jgi:hypothetical protein
LARADRLPRLPVFGRLTTGRREGLRIPPRRPWWLRAGLADQPVKTSSACWRLVWSSQ